LLQWFGRNKRDLPWRRRRTPYRVWISELMLQQTRVDQVIPYYVRFMKRFPSLKALAEAPRHDVLKAWEGLGYYARARHMHETARRLVQSRKGRFPASYEELKSLPGIGAYTASAIGSLAFNLPLAVVDGNVNRVMARVTALDEDVRAPRSRALIQEWVDALMPPKRAGMFNEAIMELGALCCTPRNPDCPHCPLRRICRARQQGRSESYPVRNPRKVRPHKEVGAGIVRNRKGEILIAQRLEDSMLGGLWEFPGGTRENGETFKQCVARELKEELGIEVSVGRQVATVRHAYSHFTIELHAFFGRIRKGRPRCLHCADYAWAPVERLREYPFSRADLYIVERLEE